MTSLINALVRFKKNTATFNVTETNQSCVVNISQLPIKFIKATQVFCLLLNRANFSHDANINTRTLSGCRAEVCEILATRLLREIGNSILDLTLALTTSWNVYSGAGDALIRQAREERDENLEERVG